MTVSNLVVAHIAAGSVGLLSGAAALYFRKGSPPHRAAGNFFFVSMLIMASLGAFMAARAPDRITTLGGAVAFYLVATGWATVKRPEGAIGLFERGAALVALGAAAAGLLIGYVGSNAPEGLIDGLPYQVGYVFGSFAAIAALGDFSMILRRGVSGRRRIARHLWRMCLALAIASASFFLGQQDEFPAFIQGSPILADLALAPLAFLLFWLAFVYVTKTFKRPVA